MTAAEFERAYAERSGVTVAYLRSLGRVVRPCDCGEEDCEGWQSISRELALEEEWGFEFESIRQRRVGHSARFSEALALERESPA